MSKEKIVRSSLFIFLALFIVAAWFKLMHKPGGESFILAGFVAAAVFVITAVLEVSNSEKINRTKKLMWIVGFIFITVIAGPIYVFIARKGVV